MKRDGIYLDLDLHINRLLNIFGSRNVRKNFVLQLIWITVNFQFLLTSTNKHISYEKQIASHINKTDDYSVYNHLMIFHPSKI